MLEMGSFQSLRIILWTKCEHNKQEYLLLNMKLKIFNSSYKTIHRKAISYLFRILNAVHEPFFEDRERRGAFNNTTK